MSPGKIFRQPFPHETGLRAAIRIAAGFGIFVTVFLFLFQPFGLESASTATLIKGCIVFGSVTFVCILVPHLLLNHFFPNMFSEKNWTTGKQIVNMGAVVVLIGLVNYLVAPLLFDIELSWRAVLHYQWIALSVGILPITIYTLLIQNRLLSQYKRSAATIQKKLEEKKEQEVLRDERVVAQEQPGIEKKIADETVIAGTTELHFVSDNQGEKKSIHVNELVYIEAASNYVKIYFLQKEKLAYSIIRMTMKNAEAQVMAHSVFFRCHRTYIVNLDKIERVEGNAQGYRLKMQGGEDLVPVSRNLNREFSDRLLEFRSSLRSE